MSGWIITAIIVYGFLILYPFFYWLETRLAEELEKKRREEMKQIALEMIQQWKDSQK